MVNNDGLYQHIIEITVKGKKVLAGSNSCGKHNLRL